MNKDTINKNTYTISNINPYNFKESRIEINFRNNVTRENFLMSLLLCDVLTSSNKNYNKPSEFFKRGEQLYNARINATPTKLGNELIISFSLSFINPNFIYEKTYFNDVIKHLTDTVFDPYIINNGFEENIFNISKNSIINDIETINENPTRVAMKNLFNLLDKESNTTVFEDNYELTDIESITKEKLYSFYKEMLEHFYCNVIVVGNIDFNTCNEILAENIPLKVIKNHEVSLYNKNKFTNKLITKEDSSSFNQSTYLLLFDLNDLTLREKYYTINIFDYIFCNGSFKSKLFKKLREENSLCYGVSSFYMKFDALYGIKSQLAYKNINIAKKLVKEALNEIKKGSFDDEMINEAKKSMTDYLKTSKDSIASYAGQGLLEIIDNFPSVDERIKAFNEITKEEIIEVSKKLDLKIEYILKEKDHEKNNI